MKRQWILGLVAGTLFSATAAQAVGSHTMAGCGFGYMLFGKNTNSKGTQIIAATTNGVLGSQVFGITSGTAGCTEDGLVEINEEVEVFAAINLNNLAEEMAKGSGEYVTAFASLLGADAATRPILLSFFQENYEELFPTEETTAIEMLEALELALAENPDLFG
jgi:hypothetical protein